jgi:hypothetical protein
VLADIDRDRHQLGRVDTTGHLGEQLGLGAMDMHHEPTTSVRCEGELAPPYPPPEVAEEAPLLYQRPGRARGSRSDRFRVRDPGRLEVTCAV